MDSDTQDQNSCKQLGEISWAAHLPECWTIKIINFFSSGNGPRTLSQRVTLPLEELFGGTGLLLWISH